MRRFVLYLHHAALTTTVDRDVEHTLEKTILIGVVTVRVCRTKFRNPTAKDRGIKRIDAGVTSFWNDVDLEESGLVITQLGVANLRSFDVGCCLAATDFFVELEARKPVAELVRHPEVDRLR